MEHYTIQREGLLADAFYKYSLTSNDSSLDATLNFNNSHVVWYTLNALQGNTCFMALSDRFRGKL
jgi:hypothetical protein